MAPRIAPTYTHKLLYCVSDAATERMLLTLNQNSESELHPVPKTPS
jgi:hypothetical protein